MRICVCATQVPFSRGGAEILVEGLCRELVARGHEAELVTVPFSWNPRSQLLKSAMAWRMINLETLGGRPVDRVIATRFPSYLIAHPQKVVWLVHQFRQVYDLLGTDYSDFGEGPEDRATIDMVRRMDQRGLSEARSLFTIADNTTARLAKFNQLKATTLYPPAPLDSNYRSGPFGDYVFAAGRLDELKRFDLLIEALNHTAPQVRCKIAGIGPESERLRERIAAAGLGDRVELLGWVEEQQLLDLYANSLAVFYAPFDEDYGYVTIEAFKSGRPVLTASDAGGVLEFVTDGETGFVCPPEAPQVFAQRIDRLFADRELAATLGAAGSRRVADISWDQVIDRLTEPAP